MSRASDQLEIQRKQVAVKGFHCVEHNVKDMVDSCELGMSSIPSLIFSDLFLLTPVVKLVKLFL